MPQIQLIWNFQSGGIVGNVTFLTYPCKAFTIGHPENESVYSGECNISQRLLLYFTYNYGVMPRNPPYFYGIRASQIYLLSVSQCGQKQGVDHQSRSKAKLFPTLTILHVPHCLAS
jgi:hypothetical protein